MWSGGFQPPNASVTIHRRSSGDQKPSLKFNLMGDGGLSPSHSVCSGHSVAG